MQTVRLSGIVVAHARWNGCVFACKRVRVCVCTCTVHANAVCGEGHDVVTVCTAQHQVSHNVVVS